MGLSFKLEFAWYVVDEPSGGVDGRYGGGLATRWQETFLSWVVKAQSLVYWTLPYWYHRTRPVRRKSICLGVQSARGVFATPRSAPQTRPAATAPHSGLRAPARAKRAAPRVLSASLRSDPLICGGHPQRPRSRPQRVSANKTPRAAAQTRPGPKKKPLDAAPTKAYRDARRINKDERLRGRAVHLFGRGGRGWRRLHGREPLGKKSARRDASGARRGRRVCIDGRRRRRQDDAGQGQADLGVVRCTPRLRRGPTTREGLVARAAHGAVLGRRREITQGRRSRNVDLARRRT